MSANLEEAATSAQEEVNGSESELEARQGALETELKNAPVNKQEKIRKRLIETRQILRKLRPRTLEEVRALIGKTIKPETVAKLVASLSGAQTALAEERKKISQLAAALDGFSDALSAFNKLMGQIKTLSQSKEA